MNKEPGYFPPYRTRRLCHEAVLAEGLVKYGVFRHYAHPKCALAAEGVKFFDRLTRWQLRQFPALVAADFGLLDELRKRVNG